MRRIGLTGGISCGKSTVSAFFLKKGIPVLDADQVARDIVAVGSEGLAAIVQCFGEQYILKDGSLNRLALRGLIISDPSAKKQLEGITHPRIFAAILGWERIQLLLSQSICIVDAALMIETGSYLRYDSIIVVSCDDTVQIARLAKRNQISEKEAKNWIATQMPLAQKTRYADWLIDNSDSLEQLQSTLENNWKNILHF